MLHPRFTRAAVVCDSIIKGTRITTLLTHYPWPIHAEVLRHRILSHSVASSRAIPLPRQIESVEKEPYVPYKWGANQKGMVAETELPEEVQKECIQEWLALRDKAVASARWFAGKMVHKENPSQFLKGFGYTDDLITGTEWENFFNLRCHPDARAEINALAVAVRQALDDSTPVERDFHLPFVETLVGDDTDVALRGLVERDEVAPDEFLKFVEDSPDKVELLSRATDPRARMLGRTALAFISAARCARLSYGRLDGAPLSPLEDFKAGYGHALHGHFSVLEHQAFAYTNTTHLRSNLTYPWTQFRKLLRNEAVFRSQRVG